MINIYLNSQQLIMYLIFILIIRVYKRQYDDVLITYEIINYFERIEIGILNSIFFVGYSCKLLKFVMFDYFDTFVVFYTVITVKYVFSCLFKI